MQMFIAKTSFLKPTRIDPEEQRQSRSLPCAGQPWVSSGLWGAGAGGGEGTLAAPAPPSPHPEAPLGSDLLCSL